MRVNPTEHYIFMGVQIPVHDLKVFHHLLLDTSEYHAAICADKHHPLTDHHLQLRANRLVSSPITKARERKR